MYKRGEKLLVNIPKAGWENVSVTYEESMNDPEKHLVLIPETGKEYVIKTSDIIQRLSPKFNPKVKASNLIARYQKDLAELRERLSAVQAKIDGKPSSKDDQDLFLIRRLKSQIQHRENRIEELTLQYE